MIRNLINTIFPKFIGIKLMLLYKVKPKRALYKAFLLFCTPRNAKVLTHQIDFLEKNKYKILKYKLKNIQTYNWSGSGKRVLLVHGWDSHTYRWRSLIEHLTKENYNIFAFDAPGHGNSEHGVMNIPIYEAVLDLVIKDFSPNFVIGHSMGAMTSIFNQSKAKQSTIEKLVLLGSPSDMVRIVDGFKKVLGLSRRFMSAVESYFYSKYGYTYKDFNMSIFSKKINITSLVIHDKNDKIAPFHEAEAIHNALKYSTLVMTEKGGHSLHTTHVYKTILNFLQK